VTLPRAPMHSFGFLEEPWMRQAACRDVDPQIFFVDDTSATTSRGKKIRRVDYPVAREVCASCPFTGLNGPCLEHALATHSTFGLWAGFSPLERAKLQRQRSRWRREMSA